MTLPSKMACPTAPVSERILIIICPTVIYYYSLSMYSWITWLTTNWRTIMMMMIFMRAREGCLHFKTEQVRVVFQDKAMEKEESVLISLSRTNWLLSSCFFWLNDSISNLELLPPSCTSAVLDGLETGRLYQFRVYSENAAGMSDALLGPRAVRIQPGIGIVHFILGHFNI